MKKDVTQILCDLINIPSFGKIQGNHDIVTYIKNELIDSKEIVPVISENGNCNLLIGINCKLHDLDDAILLSGHIDTVKPSNNHRPLAIYSPDAIEGLGASDMKSFIAVVLSIKDDLYKMNKPIILSITSDEEDDYYGIDSILKEMTKRNINPQFTIVGEPTNLNLSVKNRGNAIFNSTMQGVSCHTSTPEKGINAINLSMKFISELENLSERYKNDAIINVTSVNGGIAPNIVPNKCDIQFSIRCTYSSILEKIQKELVDIHESIASKDTQNQSLLTNVFTIPPFELKNREFLLKLSNALNLPIVDSQFTTEAGDIQKTFPDSKIVIWGPGDPNCIHREGEKVYNKNLYKYKSILKNTLRNQLIVEKGANDERTL
ncbi:MAG: M20/M25/M40 family metallo-hydrolase [Christensenellales bacterium]